MSPGTWPGGAWVPGGPRPCLLLLLLVHDPNFVFRNFHQDVSRFTVHKGLRPNSRIMYRFFTSHQPMMNEQDQVTWTNWPASKKREAISFGTPAARDRQYRVSASCMSRRQFVQGVGRQCSQTICVQCNGWLALQEARGVHSSPEAATDS